MLGVTVGNINATITTKLVVTTTTITIIRNLICGGGGTIASLINTIKMAVARMIPTIAPHKSVAKGEKSRQSPPSFSVRFTRIPPSDWNIGRVTTVVIGKTPYPLSSEPSK
jgi:hypothetical protein